MPSVPAPELLEEIAELIASGVDAYVATRDAAMDPESMYAMGVRVHPNRARVTVYVPEALAGATRANLEDNAEIALTLTRPHNCVAAQLKGLCVGIRPSDDTDREFQTIFRGALVEAYAFAGVPRSTTRRLAWWPSLALDIAVRDVFTQTPGPRAGQPMARS